MKRIKGKFVNEDDYHMLSNVFMNINTDLEFEDWAEEQLSKMQINSDEEYVSNKGRTVQHRYDEDVQMPDNGVESAESSIERIKRYPARRKIMLKEKFKKMSTNN